MTAKERKTLLWFSIGVTLLLIVTGPWVYDSWRVYRISEKARAVKVGDSKSAVRTLLGKPDWSGRSSRLFPLSKLELEQWAYGTEMDWSDFSCNTNIRGCSGPVANDVVIEFDDSGKVFAVWVPYEKSKK